MADLLSLKNNLESETIDLLSGTYVLRTNSWATGTPQPTSDVEEVPFGAHTVFQNYLAQVETIDLIAQSATHSTIRAAQQDIHQALDAARLYNQHPLWTLYSASSGPDPWFLHWNIDGESEKRSLIYEGSLAGINEQCAGPFITSNVSLLRMALLRHPFWEPRIGNSEHVTSSTISAMGGTAFASTVEGDVWARIASVQLYGKSGSGPIYRTWLGIREEMAGTANFEPIWDMEYATKSGGAANSTSRADYDGASHIRVAGPAASLTQYLELSVGALCGYNGHSNYHHQLGEYLVLCRCAVDTGTVGLQLRYGFDQGTMMPADEVFVSNTSWRLIELGNIVIPPLGGNKLNVTGNDAQYTTVQIYAEQVSGTSNLDIDLLIMIPRHHLWTAVGGAIETSAAYAHVGETTVADKVTCYATGPSVPRYTLEYSMKDWYLPTGNSIIVAAGERSSIHATGDDMGLTLNYYPRWGMYRSDSGT